MLLNLISRTKSSLVNNSFYLYISYFADYVLTLFLLPFISRAIGAIELGKIGLAQTFGLLIILFIEFGSSLMATREVARIKDDQTNLKKFIDSLITFKIFLIPIALIFTLLSILYFPTFKDSPNYVAIVVFGAIFQGISPTWYFQGIEKMKIIALSKLFFRLIGFIAIIVYVKSSDDSWIVLASYSLSSAATCLYLYFKIIKKLGLLTLSQPSQSKLIFSKSMPSLLITIIPMIYQNIGVMALSVFVNPVQLGFYYGASRIHRAFNTLFGPISQSFFPIISSINIKNKTKSRLLIKNYLILITIIGLLFFLISYLFADIIISIFLGSQFSEANNLLRLFALSLPLTAASNALGRQWLMVKNKDLYYLVTQILSLAIALTVFFYLINNYGIRAYPISLLFYEISTIVMILIFILKNGWN